MKGISAVTTMEAYGYFLLPLMLLSSTANGQSSSPVKLGFTAGTDFQASMAPVCNLAIKDVQQNNVLSNNVAINVMVMEACPTNGDPPHIGVTNTADMYYVWNMDALIGPACSTEFLDSARLCAQWQIPALSWWATDPTLGDKTIFSTTVQLSTRNQNGFAVAIYTVITRKYLWKNVAFVGSSTLNTPGPNLLLGIQALFAQKNDILSLGYIEYPGLLSVDDITNSPNFAKIKTTARIYIAMFGSDLDANTNFVLAVHRANLTDNGFVFIIPWVIRKDDLPWMVNGTVDTEILTAFSKMLIVEPGGSNAGELYEFSESILRRAQLSPSSFTAANSSEYELILLAAAYDACYAYAFGLGRLLDGSSTIVRNASFSSGLVDNLKSVEFPGALGTVYLDERAERLPSFELRSISFSPTEIQFNLILLLQANESACTPDGLICFAMTIQDFSYQFFPNGVPPDIPKCGFEGNLCTSYWLVIMVVVAVCVIAGLVIIAIFTWKRYKQLQVYKLHWKVTKESMKIIEQNPLMDSLRSLKEETVDGVKVKKRFLPVYAIVGTIKAELVDFKQHQHISFTKENLQFLFGLKQLSHENLTSFMGICYNEGDRFYVLYILVERGTLEGLEYLHKSSVGFHGCFSPKTCLIDGNWVLKLTGFGMADMLSELFGKHLIGYPEGYYVQLNTLLHMAPEQLRASNLGKTFPSGSSASDIYSFGMTLFQIMYRTAPFDESSMSTEEILQSIATPGTVPLRPAIPKEIKQNEELVTLLRSCWSERPGERPTIRRIHQVTSAAFGYLKGNLVDQMISLTEKYAQNLERLVADRTQMLVEAQTQTDRLLYEMLPLSVARQLKAGNTVEPRSYSSATVLFCQLAEFSVLCSHSTPEQIVKFLNDIFMRFDEVVARFDAYKVETTGETYMVVSGVPQENDGRHVHEIAEVSLHLRTTAVTFVVDHYNDFALAVRIGFHCGPLAAGVIGMSWPRYCLFGDTVNFASRMQSTAEPNHIQIAQSTATFLLQSDKYLVTERGFVNVKGKGEVNTFWLDRKRSNSAGASLASSSSH